MIFIFDDDRTPQNPDGNRMSIVWHGVDYNKIHEDAESGVEELPFGIFTETIGFNTPVNFQSEMHPDIYKNGGGIEYYNPRIGSRVLTMRCLIRERTLARLGARLQEIQDDFSPLELQWNHGITWPQPNGRPGWCDPWSTKFQGMEFTRMNDGFDEVEFVDAFPDNKVPLQYAVVPLTLPDPVISATQTGMGAALDISFLILDGGRAFAQSLTTKTGTTQASNRQVWGQALAFPRIKLTMSGAGSATHTLTVTGGGTHYSPTALVLDLSGLSNNEVVTILCRDRKVYTDGVLTQGLWKSGDYPIITPMGSSVLTYTHTNNNNISLVETEWWETMLN